MEGVRSKPIIVLATGSKNRGCPNGPRFLQKEENLRVLPLTP